LISLLDLNDPNAAMEALIGREDMESTVIAPGLALPHARLRGIDRIRAAIGLSAAGIHDPKSHSTIHVIVLFLSPEDNMKPHLHFLARVSLLFQKKGFSEKLLKAGTPAKALDVIHKAEAALPSI
jgi:PTS system nitrogen regulatory IIA component